MPSSVVAVIIAFPLPAAVTFPSTSTVATLSSLDFQINLSYALSGSIFAVICRVSPTFVSVLFSAVSVSFSGAIFTVIAAVALCFPSADVAVMVAVPLATAVTLPSLSTVATFSSLDVHVIVLLSA